MNANQLMIGDWVDFYLPYVPGKKIVTRHRVTRIYECGLVAISDRPNLVHEDHIEPTPLTAEILEKNGFGKSRIGKGWLQWNQKQGGLVDIFTDNKGISGMPMAVTFGHNVVNMHAHYVHELQHALRLCGINKDIEL